MLTVGAFLAGAAWLYLLLFRDGFWGDDHRLVIAEPRSDSQPSPVLWPSVVAVIPARDQAAVISTSVASLRRQDYLGALSIVVVDDESSDGMGDIARSLEQELDPPLLVVQGGPVRPGWTRRVWAMEQGVRRALEGSPAYLWFTEADVEHDPGVLRALVARAEKHHLHLTSTEVIQSGRGVGGRWLVPASAFLLRILHPLGLVSRSDSNFTGAGGSSMLVWTEALQDCGGLEMIRDHPIPGWGLAARIKPSGPIWWGLTTASRSVQPLGMVDVWRGVAGSAYARLDYSKKRLALSLIVIALLYVVPLAAVSWGALTADWTEAWAGLVAWTFLGAAYVPVLRSHGENPAWALLLPSAAVLYWLMLLDSARRLRRGARGTV